MTQDQGLTNYRINDLIALQKFTRGDWTINFGTGEIWNKKGDEIGHLNQTTGYIECKTTENGADFKIPKHRAIYLCYHGVLAISIGQQLEVDHIDGNKQNNSISNLVLVTPSQNCLNPNTLMRGEKAPHAKITNAIAEHIRTLYIAGGFTCRKLAGMYGVTHQSIESLINNRTYVSDSEVALRAAELIKSKPRCKAVPRQEVQV